MYDRSPEFASADDAAKARIQELEAFVKRLLDPEGFGHAVTGEVRDEVRRLFGMKRVES
jgi:plasmid stabilization system protein ParE